MNLRDMHYLVTVADLRNFSQAAETCHVSQPTLSNQIKKLEETLGVMIFERTNKRVMPTETGEEIIQCARKILHEEEHMRELAQLSHDPLSGRFRIGAFPTLSPYLLPKLVPHIKQSMPKLKLMLMEEKTTHLLDLLRTGQLDAAFLALPIHDDYLTEAPLFEDEFLLAVPTDHVFARKNYVTQDAIARHRMLLLEEGHCMRDQALDVCQHAGMEEDTDFRATSLETLRQMVRAGTGITLIPKMSIRKDEEDIVYIPFKDNVPKRTIGLVWRKTSARTEVMKKLIAIFKQNHLMR